MKKLIFENGETIHIREFYERVIEFTADSHLEAQIKVICIENVIAFVVKSEKAE